LPYILAMPSISGPKLGEVVPSFDQAQSSIWTTPHFVCVVIILAVVFPKAHRADLVLATPSKSLESTTWTTEYRLRLQSLHNVAESVVHLIQRTQPYRLRNVGPQATSYQCRLSGYPPSPVIKRCQLRGPMKLAPGNPECLEYPGRTLLLYPGT
jgi:hypothetical protein